MDKQRKYGHFLKLLLADNLPLPRSEVVFHPERKWRFDFAWTGQKVAVEINGGAFTQGRHTRGAGFIGDMEKMNQANLLGWCVLQFTPQQIMKVETYELIRKALNRT